MSERIKEFHESLQKKMDEYVHFIYKVTRHFPKEERYGVTSQLQRSSLSIILNYIEGFARLRPGSALLRNFWETAYASLKESKYLVGFSWKENFLREDEYKEAIVRAEEIGAMLWTSLEHLKKKS